MISFCGSHLSRWTWDSFSTPGTPFSILQSIVYSDRRSKAPTNDFYKANCLISDGPTIICAGMLVVLETVPREKTMTPFEGRFRMSATSPVMGLAFPSEERWMITATNSTLCRS